MRKVLLFLVVSFIIMGILGAHAIIPDSATVEIPTPESDYVQDTDVQSESFVESEPVAVEPSVVEVTEQVSDEMSAVDSETSEEMVAESFNDVEVEPEPVVVETVVDEDSEQVTDELAIVDSEQVEETTVETFNDTDVQSENFADPDSVVIEPVVRRHVLERQRVVRELHDDAGKDRKLLRGVARDCADRLAIHLHVLDAVACVRLEGKGD